MAITRLPSRTYSLPGWSHCAWSGQATTASSTMPNSNVPASLSAEAGHRRILGRVQCTQRLASKTTLPYCRCGTSMNRDYFFMLGNPSRNIHGRRHALWLDGGGPSTGDACGVRNPKNRAESRHYQVRPDWHGQVVFESTRTGSGQRDLHRPEI